MRESQSQVHRRKFLGISAVGGLLFTTGCSGLLSQINSDNSDDSDPPPQTTATPPESTPTPTRTATPEPGTKNPVINIKYVGENEFNNGDVTYTYSVENLSGKLLRYVGIPHDEQPYAFYNIEPGESRRYTVEMPLDSPEARLFDVPAVPAPAKDFTPYQEAADYTAQPGDEEYRLPNETGINPDDIQEVKVEPLVKPNSLVTGRGLLSPWTPRLRYSGYNTPEEGFGLYPASGWTFTWGATVTGVGAEKSFTFNVPKPDFELTIDTVSFDGGYVLDPVVSLTAQSEYPTLGAEVHVFLENINGNRGDSNFRQLGRAALQKRDDEPVFTKKHTKRPGSTKKVTLDDSIKWEFPVKDGDRICALLAAGHHNKHWIGAPVSYTETPLKKFV